MFFLDGSPFDDDTGLFKIWGKRSAIICLISSILVVFIPSKETLIQMLIAKNVTFNLVNQTTDVVTTVYNDIINLFN